VSLPCRVVFALVPEPALAGSRSPSPGPLLLAGGGRQTAREHFFIFIREKRLTSLREFRIFHLPRRCPPGPIFPASKFRRQVEIPLRRDRPPGRPRKKDLDFGDSLRETGNPPLDGTGSLKTEQRRTREGRRKSSSRGDLRDSFEGLVRRDEPGSERRWRAGLQ